MGVIVVSDGKASISKCHCANVDPVCVEDGLSIYELGEGYTSGQPHMIPLSSGTRLLFEPLLFEKEGLTLSQFKIMWNAWLTQLQDYSVAEQKQVKLHVSAAGHMKVTVSKRMSATKKPVIPSKEEEEEEDEEEEDEEEEEEKPDSDYDSEVSSVSGDDSEAEDDEEDQEVVAVVQDQDDDDK